MQLAAAKLHACAFLKSARKLARRGASSAPESGGKPPQSKSMVAAPHEEVCFRVVGVKPLGDLYAEVCGDLQHARIA
jgi:hypothetical protein